MSLTLVWRRDTRMVVVQFVSAACVVRGIEELAFVHQASMRGHATSHGSWSCSSSACGVSSGCRGVARRYLPVLYFALITAAALMKLHERLSQLGKLDRSCASAAVRSCVQAKLPRRCYPA